MRAEAAMYVDRRGRCASRRRSRPSACSQPQGRSPARRTMEMCALGSSAGIVAQLGCGPRVLHGEGPVSLHGRGRRRRSVGMGRAAPAQRRRYRLSEHIYEIGLPALRLGPRARPQRRSGRTVTLASPWWAAVRDTGFVCAPQRLAGARYAAVARGVLSARRRLGASDPRGRAAGCTPVFSSRGVLQRASGARRFLAMTLLVGASGTPSRSPPE